MILCNMNEILDHNNHIIKPTFKGRWGEIGFRTFHLVIVTLFFALPMGNGLIENTFRVLFQDLILLLQIAALIVVLFFSVAYFNLVWNWLWYVFGKEIIDINRASMVITRKCILHKEMVINFSQVERMEYHHTNVKSGIRKMGNNFPFFFGKLKITLEDQKTYICAFDLSHSEYLEIATAYHAWRKQSTEVLKTG